MKKGSAHGNPNRKLFSPDESKFSSRSGSDAFTPSIAGLEERLRFQELIFNLSTQFISLPSSEVDQQIEQALRHIVEFLGLDRSSLSEFSKDLKELCTTHSYAVPGIDATPRIIANKVWPYLTGKLIAGENFVLENSVDMPEEAALEKSYSLRTGLKSHLSIPVSIGGILQCAISFSTFRKYRSWPEEYIGQLKKLGEVFAQAIYRKQKEAQLRELQEKQLQFERVLSDISARFINLPAHQVNSEIENVCLQVCEYLELDMIAVWQQVTNDPDMVIMTHRYPRLSGIPDQQTRNPASLYPWVWKQIRASSIVKVSSLKELPTEAAVDRENAELSGIKSNISLPLSTGGGLPFGVLALNTTREERSWSDELVMRLQLVAQMFANAIQRKRTEEEIHSHLENLKKQYEFEMLISGLSARFVNLESADVDHQIEEGLRLLVEFFGGDRSSLLQITDDKKELITIHSYALEGIKKLERIPFKKGFPWVAAKVLQGEPFYFSSANQFPTEATVDRVSFKKLDIRSNISMPLFVGGDLKYTLTMSAIRQERNWPEEVIPRLRLIGEIFVNALIRKDNAKELQKRGEQLQTAYTEITRLSEQLKRENVYLQEEIRASLGFEEMIGQSGGLKYLFYKIKQVAPTDTTVLIEGETGTGKELVARTLHAFSNRKSRSLIKVDCASLPANLIESELFGHQKGAFTGAHAQRIGRFELADGATIFLDEIAEIPLGLQSKLLRVLQYGEFERLGSSHTLKVNVRVIAATNRILKEEVKNGHFREDLYYRLSIFPLSLPPLRERKEDIPLLAEAFVQRFAKKMGKNIATIPSKIQNALQNYSWPGNVRELENVIERAVITTDGSSLQLMDLLEETPARRAASAPKVSLEERERDYIIEVLEDTYWRIEGKNGAAVILGLHPDTLRSRIKKLGIRRPSSGTL